MSPRPCTGSSPRRRTRASLAHRCTRFGAALWHRLPAGEVLDPQHQHRRERPVGILRIPLCQQVGKAGRVRVRMFTAWVDESGSDMRRDPGTYMLSAALVENGKEEGARAAMQALLLPGQKKLHWRDDASRHALIVEAIAALGVEHFVVVHCAPDIDIRPERQRRLCLGRLVPELAELGVTRVIAESRGRADDRRDAQAVEHLRQSRRLSGPFHIDHARGPFDPLLWVPDACCGVITRHRCGDSTHYEKLSTQITMCEVES